MKSESHNLNFGAALTGARLMLLLVTASTLLTLLSAGSNAFGQSATATVGGAVVDSMGAVIPAASVTVSSSATGLQRQVLTDESGLFTFPLLPPGTYTLRIEREGFAPVEIPAAVLQLNAYVSYRIQLKVGAVGAYVLVDDSSRLGSSTSVGTTIDSQFVANLPFNGLGINSLYDVAPGVVLTRTTFNEQGQFSVNGQRANTNYFTVDGVSANFGVSAGPAPGQAAAGSLPALTAFGATNNLVSVDALQELAIQTSSYAPEFGRLPGAQLSLVTRAGTNDLHGSAFAFFRHDAFSSNDWFASSRGLGKPHLRQDDFGGTIGGPLIRDKAFYFVSYERLRMRQPRVAITEVPGSGLRDFMAPVVLRPFLNAFPKSNWFELTGKRLGNGLGGLEEFAASYSDPASLDALAVRLDGNVSERLALFGRYSIAPSSTVQRGRGYVYGNSGLSLSTLSHSDSRTTMMTAGARWEVKSGITNDTRINWSAAHGSTEFTLDDFGRAIPFDVKQYVPNVTASKSALQFMILGGVNTSLGLGRNADNEQRQFNLVSNLAIVAASHQLKLGVDYRRLSPVYEPTQYFQQVVFPAAVTPNRNPSIEAGRASQVTIFGDVGPRFPVFTNFSVFAQDVWRASSRLSLTYGVRLELNAPPNEKGGHHPLIAGNVDDLTALTLRPAGTPLWKTNFLNLAPRLGLAYQLAGTGTVLRAGAGLYYDSSAGPAAQVFGSVVPYTSVKRLDGVLYPLNQNQALSPPVTQQPPFDTVYAFDPNLKLPYALQWNVTVDQPLGSNQTTTASYVGAAGRRLLRQEILPASQIFREVRAITNSSTSDYHALQLQYQTRFSRSVQGQVSYTWAHSIDDASEDSQITASSQGLTLQSQRSSSDFDIRHSIFGAVTYNLKSLATRRFSELFLGDLSLDAIFRMRTATPVNVFIGKTLLSGDQSTLTLPDVVAGRPIYVEDAAVAGGRRINRQAFAQPGTTGQSIGRNALRGFGMWQVDMALHREFGLSERFRLQARAEVFNVFNHPNFGNPIADLGSGLFGQSIETLGSSLGSGGVNGGLSPIYQVGGPRTAQLALRLKF